MNQIYKSKTFIITIAHILFVSPLLFYIAIKKQNIKYPLLILIFGILFLLYQSYLVYNKGLNKGFINLIHMIIFAPLIIYIAIMILLNKQVFWGIYWLFMPLAFAALGYNTYKLFKII